MSVVTRRLRRTVRPLVRNLTGVVGTIRAVHTDQPYLVMTYDDGPDPQGTEAVLSALAGHGATATFFVLVARARRHRSLLTEIAAAGHEVALHGQDHQRLTGMPAREVLRRTRAGRAELEDLVAAPVRWFRPPYGAQLPSTWWAIRQCGLSPVVWGPTPADWEAEPEPRLAARAMAGAVPGAILLAHDGWAGPDVGVDHGPPPPIDRGRLARLMLEQLAARGLAGRSLRETLRHGTTAQWAWFRR